MKQNIFKGLKSFLLLWSSQAVSALGTSMTSYALIIWTYARQGTASSVTLLSFFTFLPTIALRFVTGAIADRWNKKRIMLAADAAAACGTAVIFALYSQNALQVWHLYVTNTLLSFMDAFQSPAAHVATSLLVPREQYARVSGLQSLSGAAVSIIAPALGSVLLAAGGLELVLAVDLASFAVAFGVLGGFIRIPDMPRGADAADDSLIHSCMAGVNFLRRRAGLLRLILSFTAINFLAKLGGDGMLSAFILARSGSDQQALGIVQSAGALGTLVGGAIVTLMRPVRRKVKVVFGCCAAVFLIGDTAQSLTDALPLWAVLEFASYVLVAVLGANLMALVRSNTPMELQGRVFSAQSTIQNGAIPLGLLLGGALADHVFEPFMAGDSPAQRLLAQVFGVGSGAGIAVMFCIVGVLGCAVCLSALMDPIYKRLDE